MDMIDRLGLVEEARRRNGLGDSITMKKIHNIHRTSCEEDIRLTDKKLRVS